MFRVEDGEKAAAVMYSGGMDSTVIVASLLKDGYKVFPICFDDGSLNYSLRRKVAIEETLKELGLLNQMIEVRIPNPEPLRISKDLFGFVPGYKMFMILAAMSYCQILNVTELYCGYNTDNKEGGYLDEGQKFMTELEDLYYRTYAVETNNDFYFGKRIRVINPFFDKTKAEMTKYGAELGVDFSTTISCRQVKVGAGVVHCGKCEVCRRRAVAFKDAGIEDPTIWHTKPNV